MRQAAWESIAQRLPLAMFEQASREISLEQVPEIAAELLAGQGHGRVVVNLQG